MASVLDLARLSEASYSVSGAIDGWTLVASHANANTGFYAAAYESDDATERVVAIRGTEPWAADKDQPASHQPSSHPRRLEDVGDDIDLAFGDIPEQVNDARQFVSGQAAIAQQKQQLFTVTGHSLGGGIAQVVGANQGLATVTFNAPGMRREMVSNSAYSAKAGGHSNMVNYRAEGCLVSDPRATGAAVGDSRLIANPNAELHSGVTGQIDSVVGAKLGQKLDTIHAVTNPIDHWNEPTNLQSYFTQYGASQGVAKGFLEWHGMENMIQLLENQASAGTTELETQDALGRSTLKGASASSKPNTYRVKAGDSLSKIAKAKLGDASRWREIFNLNRNQIANPDRIDVGQELALPG